MTKKHGYGQGELIPRSKKPTIPIDSSHQLAVLTVELDWDELLEVVEEIRSSKMKNAAGRPPHLRAMVGALLILPPCLAQFHRRQTAASTSGRACVSCRCSDS